MASPDWRDLKVELERHADQMTLFGRDFTLLVDGKPLDDIPTTLFVNEIDVDTGAITEGTYTTQLEVELEPLSPEQEAVAEKLADYWAKIFEADLLRQLCGEPSEYQHSLRAAGAKV
jgi:hypothetical protein